MRQAELDLEFTELSAPVAGRIGDRRVSAGNLVTGGTGAPPRCSPPSCRSIRSASSSPWMRHRICATSASPASGTDGAEPRHQRAGAAQADRRAGLQHDGRIDFVDNAIDRVVRHDPRPRRVRQSRRRLHARHVRRACRWRRRRRRGAAGAGCRHRHRAGAQVRLVVDADNVAKPKYVTLGPVVDGLRVIKAGLDAGRPRHRQWADAGAAGREGHAADEAAADAAVRKPPADPQPTEGGTAHAHLAFLHRPADLRRGHLDRVRDPRRGVRSRACRSRNIPKSRRRSSTSPASIRAPAPRSSPPPSSRRSSSRSTASRTCSTSRRTRPATAASRSR